MPAFAQINTAGCDCAPLMPAGLDQQGRRRTRDWQWPDTIATEYDDLRGCAPEGGRYAEPVAAMESMWRHRRTAAAVKGGLALAAALALAGYLAHITWPLA